MLVVLFGIWLIIWALSSLSFDALIKYQHAMHNDDWVTDGRPRGMFFRPEGGSTAAMWFASFSVPRSKPVWVEGDPRAERLYARYRLCGTAVKWYALMFIPLLIIVIST